jgi:hypothetical protein
MITQFEMSLLTNQPTNKQTNKQTNQLHGAFMELEVYIS